MLEPILCKVNSQVADNAHSTLRNQQESPLLRLPAEIRNAIYHYALGGNNVPCHDLDMFKDPVGDWTPTRPVSNLTTITRACRQTHAESALLFFKINQFGTIFDPYEPMYQAVLPKLTEMASELWGNEPVRKAGMSWSRLHLASRPQCLRRTLPTHPQGPRRPHSSCAESGLVCTHTGATDWQGFRHH